MANPRKAVSYKGIDYLAVPYAIDDSTITYSESVANGSSAVGKAVMFSASKTVALTSDNARVVGTLIKVEADNYATVQIEGYTELPAGVGAATTVGAPIVGAVDGSGNRGYVKAATADAHYINAAHRIDDATTSTALVIKLGG